MSCENSSDIGILTSYHTTLWILINDSVIHNGLCFFGVAVWRSSKEDNDKRGLDEILGRFLLTEV